MNETSDTKNYPFFLFSEIKVHDGTHWNNF